MENRGSIGKKDSLWISAIHFFGYNLGTGQIWATLRDILQKPLHQNNANEAHFLCVFCKENPKLREQE